MWTRLTSARFLIGVMLVGGLFLRVWHFAANHTVWYDESVLLVNVMEKDFAGLLGPLHHAVAAPPLFLGLLKSIHLTAGDVTYFWRLPPFLFSVAGLLLMVPLARRLFDPPAAVLAIGLVAASDGAVWYGCCIKPYAGDAAIATGLLLFLTASAGRSVAKRLLFLAAVTPVLIGSSYTSVFTLGAVLLALLPTVRAGGRRAWAAWVLAAAVAAGTLALLYFGPMKAQRDPNLFYEWRFHFPNYAEPTSVPYWSGKAILGVFQEAVNPSGFVLGLLAPLGAWGLWRGGRREVAIACGAAFGLAFLAALVKAYPIGQHRLSFFLMPAAVVLGSAGVQVVIRWRWWAGIPLAVVLFLAADGLSLYHLYRPWLHPNGAAVRRYVTERRQPGDVVLSDDALPPTEEVINGVFVRNVRGNYLYFFFGELKPLAAGSEVPVGGRAWVVMDHYTPEQRRAYIEGTLKPLGFELVEEKTFGPDWEPFAQASAYLYVRVR